MTEEAVLSCEEEAEKEAEKNKVRDKNWKGATKATRNKEGHL